jgi:hypothetical protein
MLQPAKITASPLHFKMQTEKCKVPNEQSNYPINTEVLMYPTLTVEKLFLLSISITLLNSKYRYIETIVTPMAVTT